MPTLPVMGAVYLLEIAVPVAVFADPSCRAGADGSGALVE
jgi:hypothetical protein